MTKRDPFETLREPPISDELDRIRQDRKRAREWLLHLMRAPYTRMSPWAITGTCEYLEHPSKFPDVEDGCVCGRYREGRPTTAPEEELA